mgnify:FL=1|jgi:hypothetical protein
MNIPIYKSEKTHGLEELILSTASIAYSSPVDTYIPDPEQQDNIKQLMLSDNEVIAENKDQFDLFYLRSVLVSTGWNKNDDVFDLKETWAAKDTPEDKQFNFMHDESDIIGHITGSIVIDRDGKEVIGMGSTPENDFDIVTSAVLYNSWTDLERRERMNTIIADIQSGKWFVSMEALFSDFDYAVVTPEGEHKTIARNEESAFLTKHLRAYGGYGQYDGYTVGRLLRNINFSGKGLVSNPANPRSVILNDNSSDLLSFAGTSEAKLISESSIKEISDMSDNVLENQIAELKAELVQAKSAAEALKTEVISQKDEELQSKIEAFEATVAKKEEAIVQAKEALEAAEAKVTELEEVVASKDAELATASESIEAHQAEKKLLARKTALLEAGVEGEGAEAAIERFAEASDEMFKEIVQILAAMYKKKADEKSSKEDDKKDDSKKDDNKDEDKDKKLPPWLKKKGASADEATEAEEADEVDEAEAEASDEVLETAEEEVEAALTDAGEDSSLEAKTAASDWLESNVLRSTARIQE